jgi:hypothetical protein
VRYGGLVRCSGFVPPFLFCGKEKQIPRFVGMTGVGVAGRHVAN